MLYDDLKNLVGKSADCESEQLNESLSNYDSHQLSDLIFVGGFGRSGTTLMRSILDSHPAIKCGPELKLIPPFLGILNHWTRDKSRVDMIKQSGTGMSIIEKISAQYIYNLINLHHNDNTQRLCNKDPYVALHISLLHSIFPNAKFIVMFRDPRAAVISLLKKTKQFVNSTNFETQLKAWTIMSTSMYLQCKQLIHSHCIMIRYEDLVTHPKDEISKILSFLGEKWSENVLKHQEFIGSEIEVSKTEWSTSDIVKPINSLSLSAWKKNLTLDVNMYVEKHALKLFNQLRYKLVSKKELATNDDFILNNNKIILANQSRWLNKAREFSNLV